MTCDMLEPCECPSLDSCLKRFLWTNKEVGLAPHPFVGLVLQVGDAETFCQALSLDSLDPFFTVSKQGPYFTVMEEDGGDKRFVEFVQPLLLMLKQS